jgi:hypothetical protein
MSTESDAKDHVLELNFEPTWVSQPVNPYIHDEKAYRQQSKTGQNRGKSKGRPGKPRRPGHASGGPPRPARGRQAEPREHNRSRPEQTLPDLEVIFIPERNGLQTLVKKIIQAKRAFSLFDIAGLILSRPEFHAVRVSSPAETESSKPLFQCRACSMIFLKESECMDHLLDCQLDRYYEQEITEGEAPKGQFSCVVVCPRSNQVLGPPNYHGFNDALRDLHRNRFAHLSLDDLRSSLKTVHDEEVLAKWKEDARQQVLYKHKTDDLTFTRRVDVQEHFRTHYQSGAFRKGGRFIMAGPVSLELPDGPLRQLVRSAWGKENRRPLRLSIALRAAFRHHKLHAFKSANGHRYVSAVATSAIDPATAIPEIRAILEYLETHPGCAKQQLVDALSSASSAQEDSLKHLIWLRDKGHIIEFSNGALAVPSHSASH